MKPFLQSLVLQFLLTLSINQFFQKIVSLLCDIILYYIIKLNMPCYHNTQFFSILFYYCHPSQHS